MLYFSYSRKWYLYEKRIYFSRVVSGYCDISNYSCYAISRNLNIIESSKRGTAESNAKMLFKAIEYKTLANEDYDPTIINETNVVTELGIDASNYESLTIKKMNGQIYITMVGKDKLNGITVSGTKKNIRVDDSIAISEEGANHPVLAPGMIPIKWVTDHWEVTTEDDWYDYNNKEWANAVTRDCVIENEEPVNIETCSMWVWIPRYIYKISPKEEDDPSNPTTGWHKSNAGIINVQFSKGVDDNWNKAIIGNIDFSEGAIASNNKWTNHPAFTFGDIELTGIWVAKFEASSNTPEAENGGGDKTSLRVRSVPNVPSWRYITINNAFKVTRAMETVTNDFYGLGTSGKGIDTHLMKNS